MVIVNLHITAIPGKKKEAVCILRSLIGPTIVQPGCRQFKVYDNIEVDNEILLFQEWESQQKLERHISSIEFKKILAAMDLSIEPPCLSFHTIAKTSGFELLEKLCK